MRELPLLRPGAPLRQVLFLGAHPDDIEIGCGGTVARLRALHPSLDLRFVVLTSSPEREAEARHSAELFAGPEAARRLQVERFRDGFLPYVGGAVKEVFERLKGELEPDLIFTHHRADLHQDHRLVSELTWNTWRDHLILEYEIPKYDADLGHPNLFVPLEPEEVERKIKALLEAFPSQRRRAWFEPDTFRMILRLRGLESNAPGRFAEAFHARKLILGVAS
jgi:LmbE family N-acetylglucosaminyl deacetylase